MNTTTQQDVRTSVADTAADIINDYKEKPDTDRETLIERMDEETDAVFGNLVQHGRIDQYDEDDLVATAQPCAVIIQTAKADAWVEDDSGLWEGLTYGLTASIAYFSLRNLLYQKMTDLGYDSNEDYPFATDDDVESAGAA